MESGHDLQTGVRHRGLGVSKDHTMPSQVGPYRLLHRLGQGGMGDVYLALSTRGASFQKLVVLKELRSDLVSDPSFLSMFLQEAKLAGRLNHANIVQTMEAGEIDGRYVLAMEFLDGQPFSKLMQRVDDIPRIPLALRLQIICDALSGLHYAHELKDFDGKPLNIVHCDVSFPNVFLTYDGHVKLIDFGVARATGSAQIQFGGKLRYASPEQIAGDPVDRRADIFSAGVMLWECVALRRLVPRTEDPQEVLELLRSDMLQLSHAVPNVDRQLAAICDKALRVEPGERFATAEEFRKALADYLSTNRIEPGEIASLMKRKFAEERTELHEIIQAELGGAANPKVFGSPDGEVGFDDVTTVGDLSALVNKTRESLPSLSTREAESTAPTPRKRALLVPGIGIAILASGVTAWALLPGQSQSDREEATQSASPVAEHGDDVAARPDEELPKRPTEDSSAKERNVESPEGQVELPQKEAAGKEAAAPSTATHSRSPRPRPTTAPRTRDSSPNEPGQTRSTAPKEPIFKQEVERTKRRELRPLESDNPFL